MEEKEQVNRGCRVRIYPTDKQKTIMHQNMRVAKRVYNWAVARILQEYEEWGKVRAPYRDELIEKGLSDEELKRAMKKFGEEHAKEYLKSDTYSITKELVQLMKVDPQFAWFKSVPYDAYAYDMEIKVAFGNALKKFKKDFNANEKRIKELKKENPNKIYKYPYNYGFPQFKGKRDKANAYYTRITVDSIDYENQRVKLPKIGWVKCSVNDIIPKFDCFTKTINARVIFDGIGYYLTFGYYKKFESIDAPTTDVLGVDLGTKNLAILSDNTVVSNFADDEKIMKWEAEIVKLNKQISRLVDKGKSAPYKEYVLTKQELALIPVNLRGKKLAELARERAKISTWTVRRLRRKVLKRQLKINHRKEYLLHTTCENIVRKNPEAIIFEKLNVKGMMKNRRLSKRLQKTGMYKFKQCLTWHAKKHNILVYEVSQWFPSSQRCSSCGKRHREMKNLSIRTFHCPSCGMVMDRDLNASINLKKMYKSEDIKVISS